MILFDPGADLIVRKPAAPQVVAARTARNQAQPAAQLERHRAFDNGGGAFVNSGIALISATAAGALAGDRKKRAVLEAFHSVAFTSAPLIPNVG